MNAYASINFPCPVCGALFALNEKIAGRKMQCPCGKVFVAPALPVVMDDPETYDLNTAPHEPAAELSASVSTEKAIASRAGLYPQRRAQIQIADDSEPEFSIARDRFVPIALLLAGIALRISEIPYDHTLGRAHFPGAIAIILFQLILAVALMLAGVMLASKILAASFGPVGTAILKLAGMSIFAFAVAAAIVVSLNYEIRSYVIAINAIFIIYSIMFWMLFSLDVQEAILTVAICALLQNAAALVIFSTN